MKLSKEKRLHLVIVAAVTLIVIAGLWFLVITAQTQKIQQISQKSKTVQQEIDKMQRTITEAEAVAQELNAATNRLAKIESSMPSGDLFSWIVSSIKSFNTPGYKVDMPFIGPPGVGEVKLLPEFPYNQADVLVGGTAYYYDFGKFLSDLENRFPYLRVQNLTLDPGSGATPDEHEKLAFRMEVINLIKANTK